MKTRNIILTSTVAFVLIYGVSSVEMDLVDCGIDDELDVSMGKVPITQYPWVGVLFYSFFGEKGETRATTTVILIQVEFVIAPAADIGPMPKRDFRANSRVLLGEGWNRAGRRVRNYVIHPEYDQTFNTIALVQLRTPVRQENIKPVCPPPQILRSPDLFVIKFKEDFDQLQKEVVPVSHIPANLCREFYVRANLYAKKLRPPHVACAVSLQENDVCVWDAGGALVARDVWGRWQLLGLSVRGPGCGAPSRYLDIMTYQPWIENSLSKFRRITISKISKQKYIVRSGEHSTAYQRFGNCDEEEKINLVYREMISLRTDNNQYQFLTYNMSIYDNVEYTCLTLELVNASAVSEMRVKHFCPRYSYGPPCYSYKGSLFEISVFIMFSDTCRFEMFAWGFKKNMTLLDVQEWKWEEGSYYDDFTVSPIEYRGPAHETLFGFEPLELSKWVPAYDVWSTTPVSNISTTTIPARDKTTPKEAPRYGGRPKFTTPKPKYPYIEPSTLAPDVDSFLLLVQTGTPHRNVVTTSPPPGKGKKDRGNSTKKQRNRRNNYPGTKILHT